MKIVDKSTDGNKDLQTEADRAAQFCIEQSLKKKFDDKLKIIGEEEITSEYFTKEWFHNNFGIQMYVLA